MHPEINHLANNKTYSLKSILENQKTEVKKSQLLQAQVGSEKSFRKKTLSERVSEGLDEL